MDQQYPESHSESVSISLPVYPGDVPLESDYKTLLLATLILMGMIFAIRALCILSHVNVCSDDDASLGHDPLCTEASIFTGLAFSSFGLLLALRLYHSSHSYGQWHDDHQAGSASQIEVQVHVDSIESTVFESCPSQQRRQLHGSLWPKLKILQPLLSRFCHMLRADGVINDRQELNWHHFVRDRLDDLMVNRKQPSANQLAAMWGVWAQRHIANPYAKVRSGVIQLSQQAALNESMEVLMLLRQMTIAFKYFRGQTSADHTVVEVDPAGPTELTPLCL